MDEIFYSEILWTASPNLSATVLFTLQRFVLSAAHCFCVDKWGAPCKWNNQVGCGQVRQGRGCLTKNLLNVVKIAGEGETTARGSFQMGQGNSCVKVSERGWKSSAYLIDRVAYNVSSVVTVISPGYSTDYRSALLQIVDNGQALGMNPQPHQDSNSDICEDLSRSCLHSNRSRHNYFAKEVKMTSK